MLNASSCTQTKYEVLISDIDLLLSRQNSIGELLPLKDYERIDFDKLHLLLRLNFHSFLVSNKPLVSSAYAHMPARYDKLDRAVDIRLITLSRFDATHPAGSKHLLLIQLKHKNGCLKSKPKRVV